MLCSLVGLIHNLDLQQLLQDILNRDNAHRLEVCRQAKKQK